MLCLTGRGISVKTKTFMCKWKKRNVKQIEFQHLPYEYFFDHSGCTIKWYKICESLFWFIKAPVEGKESQLLKLKERAITSPKIILFGSKLKLVSSLCFICCSRFFSNLLWKALWNKHSGNQSFAEKFFFNCMASSRLNELQLSNRSVKLARNGEFGLFPAAEERWGCCSALLKPELHRIYCGGATMGRLCCSKMMSPGSPKSLYLFRLAWESSCCWGCVLTWKAKFEVA